MNLYALAASTVYIHIGVLYSCKFYNGALLSVYYLPIVMSLCQYYNAIVMSLSNTFKAPHIRSIGIKIA